MSFARVFFLRAAGVVLIASAVGVILLRDRWGTDAISSLSWAGLCAIVLGAIGYRSLGRAMSCVPEKMLGEMSKGMIIRLGVLAATQAGVFLLFGGEWGRRTLMATVVLYLLVLGVEVFTLNQALRAGVWQRASRESRETSEGNAAE